MQHASLNSIERFVPCLRGGLVASEAKFSARSGERVSVSRLASAQVTDSACIALAASPPGVLASALDGLQLRRHRAAAFAVASSTEARHNRSLQRTASPPAELTR
jgi:hypothetical protein